MDRHPRELESTRFELPHRPLIPMEDETSQTKARSVYSARLASLLDQLVAIQLDLEPICKEGSNAVPGTSAVPEELANVIAQACGVLRSAIADLRGIIASLDAPRF